VKRKLRILRWDPSLAQSLQVAANEALVQAVIDEMQASGWALVDEHVVGGGGIPTTFYLWFQQVSDVRIVRRRS
jgi:hypothetical protein